MEKDTYLTIENAAQAAWRDKGSKFLAYAFPVTGTEEIKVHLDKLRKEYYDATHHCYAWRTGPEGENSRANDDGEPSGTAGKPILGQLLSQELTNILVVVVRYFGGTKLGVPGLINAYKESTKEVLAVCKVIEKTVDAVYDITFSYLVMDRVMRIVKEVQPVIKSQNFDNLCTMRINVRRSKEEEFASKIEKVEGLTYDFAGYF